MGIRMLDGSAARSSRRRRAARARLLFQRECSVQLLHLAAVDTGPAGAGR
eukprot:SAG31_NODE_1413_length_8459_cov_7.720215_11_plen_50_part_00